MSPRTTMSSLTMSASNSNTLNAPKLHDDGSNWADYHAHVKVAMEAKGLWKHVKGKATLPKPYTEVNSVSILADGKTEATEEQVKAQERRIDNFVRATSMAKHVILSTTSAWIGMKIKSLTTAKEMWDEVKKDATNKSTLYRMDVERQLEGMRLAELSDPKSHLAKLKSHFQLMMSRYKNLMEMGSSFSEQKFITLLTSSLLNSYHPALQTLTVADRAAKLKPSSTTLAAPSQTVTTMLTGISSHELMDYFIEEAEHHLIKDTQAKQTESAMHAQSKKQKGKKNKGKLDKHCENCDKSGHVNDD